MITQELVDTMNYVGESLRQSGQTELADRLDELRGIAVGELMRANWQNSRRQSIPRKSILGKAILWIAPSAVKSHSHCYGHCS